MVGVCLEPRKCCSVLLMVSACCCFSRRGLSAAPAISRCFWILKQYPFALSWRGAIQQESAGKDDKQMTKISKYMDIHYNTNAICHVYICLFLRDTISAPGLFRPVPHKREEPTRFKVFSQRSVPPFGESRSLPIATAPSFVTMSSLTAARFKRPSHYMVDSRGKREELSSRILYPCGLLCNNQRCGNKDATNWEPAKSCNESCNVQRKIPPGNIF